MVILKPGDKGLRMINTSTGEVNAFWIDPAELSRLLTERGYADSTPGMFTLKACDLLAILEEHGERLSYSAPVI